MMQVTGYCKLFSIKGKKVKFTLEKVVKAHTGSRGIALLFY
jgi:hypothetical protein